MFILFFKVFDDFEGQKLRLFLNYIMWKIYFMCCILLLEDM